MPEFSNLSLERLGTCHPDLQRLFLAVIKQEDCVILVGHRNERDQTSAYVQGFSKLKWPNSRHNKVPSLAADVMPYPLAWEDAERTKAFAQLVLETADKLGIKITYGGNWPTWKDRDHYELLIETVDV